MKIGVYCHRLDRTGAPIMLNRLARHLAKAHTVELLLPALPPGPLLAEYEKAGIAARHGAVPQEYDAFILNTLISGELVVRMAGMVPTLYWVHEPRGGLPFLTSGRSDPRAFALADRVVFPTRWQADTLFKPYLTRDNWEVVPYGIGTDPTPRPCPFEKKPGKLYLVQLGMLTLRKGHDVTMRALAELDNPDIEVFLCGGSDVEPEFAARVRAFVEAHPRLRHTVHFLGSVPEETVNAYLQHCDAMIFPTRDDLITLSILEAMFFGCCVISSDFGPIPETVKDMDSGLLFPVEDFRAMARAIDRVFQDRGLLRRIGAAGRVRYDECHSFEAHAAGMERVLRAIARPGAR